MCHDMLKLHGQVEEKRDPRLKDVPMGKIIFLHPSLFHAYLASMSCAR